MELCIERSVQWDNPTEYARFIEYLRCRNLNLKTFNLCAHEAGETQLPKKQFAESLANLKTTDPNYATYTIRLSGGTINEIRTFH